MRNLPPTVPIHLAYPYLLNRQYFLYHPFFRQLKEPESVQNGIFRYGPTKRSSSQRGGKMNRSGQLTAALYL